MACLAGRVLAEVNVMNRAGSDWPEILNSSGIFAVEDLLSVNISSERKGSDSFVSSVLRYCPISISFTVILLALSLRIFAIFLSDDFPGVFEVASQICLSSLAWQEDSCPLNYLG
jgi:hypothetical protein